jgi:BioD-like phosphotransacetylase family protein
MCCGVAQVMVCAQGVNHFLGKLQRMNRERAAQGAGPARPLVLTTKDRADALLSLAAAHTCGTGPNVAGLLLADAHLSELG